MKQCPDLQQLDDFRGGRTDGQRCTEISGHLESCTACSDLLNTLQAHAALAGHLREAWSSVAEPVTLAPGSPPPPGPPGTAPAEDFEGYHILREVARSGFSIVYEARQEGTGQRVALKVMLASAAVDERSRLRFEREVELLGGLRHPSIVPIYHSGLHGGQYFFVMPFIAGSAPDAYADEQDLQVHDRVLMLLNICNAVAFAHHRGVIHRDLKPSNLLVDENGRIHVLDFGLAKIISEQRDKADVSLTIDRGQIIGTPAYMSPEQADGRVQDIDTRSDVYALGVTMYRILLGTMPYPVDAGLTTTLQHIQAREPRRPRSVNPGFDRELEAILLMCLEKEPQRRYHSAAALAEDVQRYLSDQPVLARAPTVLYHFRKLVQRHKLPFAALALLLVMISGFAVSFKAQRDQAVTLKRQADQSLTFLIDSMVGAADPDHGQGPEATLLSAFESMAGQIDSAFPAQPAVRGELHDVVGTVYRKVGAFDAAEDHLRQALELRRAELPDDDPELATTMHNLAAVLYHDAHYAEAEPLYRQALDIRRRVLGRRHADVVETISHLAATVDKLDRHDEAERLFRESLDMRRALLGNDDPSVARSLNNFGFFMMAARRCDEALPMFREAVTIFENHFEDHRRFIAAARNNMANCLAMQGEHHGALQQFEQALEIKRELLGNDSLSVATSLQGLAGLLRDMDDPDGAADAATEALAIRQRNLRPNHPRIPETLELLAEIRAVQGRTADSVALSRKAASLRAAAGETP